MISQVSKQGGLEQPTELQPNDSVSSISSLAKIPRGCSPLLSKEQIYRNQIVETLEDLTRLLRLVAEQEKKCKYRLSPHSNFYDRHPMV